MSAGPRHRWPSTETLSSTIRTSPRKAPPTCSDLKRVGSWTTRYWSRSRGSFLSITSIALSTPRSISSSSETGLPSSMPQVDGGRDRIIPGTRLRVSFVTPGDVAETQVLVDPLRRTLFRRTLYPTRMIADARYGTAPTIRDIEELGIKAFIPLHEVHTASSYFRL